MFLSFCVLDENFCFSNNLGFWVFLVHPETTLTGGLETSGRRAYRLFWHISRRFWVLRFGWFFHFFLKSGFWVSWSTLLWYRSRDVSRMRDFLFLFYYWCYYLHISRAHCLLYGKLFLICLQDHSRDQFVLCCSSVNFFYTKNSDCVDSDCTMIR